MTPPLPRRRRPGGWHRGAAVRPADLRGGLAADRQRVGSGRRQVRHRRGRAPGRPNLRGRSRRRTSRSRRHGSPDWTRSRPTAAIRSARGRRAGGRGVARALRARHLRGCVRGARAVAAVHRWVRTGTRSGSVRPTASSSTRSAAAFRARPRRVCDARPVAERGSVLMLMPAGVLLVLMLGAIAFDLSLVFLRQRQASSLAVDVANDVATAALDEEAFRRDGEFVLDPDRADRARRRPRRRERPAGAGRGRRGAGGRAGRGHGARGGAGRLRLRPGHPRCIRRHHRHRRGHGGGHDQAEARLRARWHAARHAGAARGRDRAAAARAAGGGAAHHRGVGPSVREVRVGAARGGCHHRDGRPPREVPAARARRRAGARRAPRHDRPAAAASR